MKVMQSILIVNLFLIIPIDSQASFLRRFSHPIRQAEQRVFIAADVPAQVKEEFGRAQTYLKQQGAFKGSFPLIDNAHITLAYVGNASLSKIAQITQGLEAVKASAMQAQTKQLETFTQGNTVSIVYLQVLCKQLSALACKVNGVVQPMGFGSELPYVPHITLARVSAIPNMQQFLNVVSSFDAKGIQFPIKSFSLKRSERLLDRTVYTDVAVYHLK